MNARGLVVNTKNKLIHREYCRTILHTTSPWIKKLSTVPPPERRKLGKCRVCKP